MRTYLKQTGFSLLELILVIVLLGVLASGAGLLITTPIQAYNDQLRRQQLVDQAEMSLRQIARDIRRALPNSIRINSSTGTGGWALEMANTLDGARYRDETGVGFLHDDDILDFYSADTAFNFLGTTNLTGVLTAGTRLVIYNTVAATFYSEVATVGATLGTVTPAATSLTLTQPTAEETRLTLSTAFQFSQQSPVQRAFFVDRPISYICDPSVGQTKIIRYSDYAFQSAQPTVAVPPAGMSGNVVTQVSACSISYDPGAAQRGGIITLSLTLNDLTGEAITLLHQVHVLNGS
jgi:MSHA biogenesis protein MshO